MSEQEDRKGAWEDSYAKRDNHVFYPHEEIIRFVSKYIRKRVGVGDYLDVLPSAKASKVLDLGCGIGRHVIYCHEMGLTAYGVDLSDNAIKSARAWASRVDGDALAQRIVQGDIRRLPWPDEFFQSAVSHGVLDSMPFTIAREGCVDLARTLKSGGLFYCDLVSGDDSRHAREYAGEEVVTTEHEKGTTQLYFNFAAVQRLFDGLFEIVECNLIRREDVLKGSYISRYHLVARKA